MPRGWAFPTWLLHGYKAHGIVLLAHQRRRRTSTAESGDIQRGRFIRHDVVATDNLGNRQISYDTRQAINRRACLLVRYPDWVDPGDVPPSYVRWSRYRSVQ